MIFRRFGTFDGGIDLPDDKEATVAAAIAPPAGVDRVRIPLAPVDAAAARPGVRAGDRVRPHQRLAEPVGDEQVAIFAPTGGRVGAIVPVAVPAGDDGWRVCEAIELTDLDGLGGIAPAETDYDFRAADDDSLRARLAEGGLTTHRPPVRPLTRWVADARRAGVDTLIANVMENTPFVTADHRLLAEHGLEVIRGLTVMARAMGAANVVLAVDNRRTDAYANAIPPARLHGIQAIALAHKYPVGADPILIKVLTRREIPPGGTALDAGVAVVDAATCWAVYRWVACGQPATARVVTVAGPRVERAGNVRVPFGAAADAVLAAAGVGGEGVSIHGSAMTGRPIPPGAVVTQATDALLALPAAPTEPPTPCIRCGWCGTHCPARLNVASLNDDFELGRLRHAERRGVLSCLDCGICTYVCPARLPLAHRMRMLKQVLRPRAVAVGAVAAAPGAH